MEKILFEKLKSLKKYFFPYSFTLKNDELIIKIISHIFQINCPFQANTDEYSNKIKKNKLIFKQWWYMAVLS